ncbi:hypothetical protein IC575_024658 [Cucumis melo]
MPFGLSNAPSIFDDILVFSRTLDEYHVHLQQLFKALANSKLYINLKKCLFFGEEIALLGFIIRKNHILMDEKKVEAIKNWLIPTSIKEVQAFVSLASFCSKFIHNFSTITTPITDCLEKVTFLLRNKQQDNFQSLKEKLSNKLVLKLPNFFQPFKVVVDACGTGIGVVLSQLGHLIEYFSLKLSPSRQTWSTYKQEMYALVCALK